MRAHLQRKIIHKKTRHIKSSLVEIYEKIIITIKTF